jgi:hypothetical protein
MYFRTDVMKVLTRFAQEKGRGMYAREVARRILGRPLTPDEQVTLLDGSPAEKQEKLLAAVFECVVPACHPQADVLSLRLREAHTLTFFCVSCGGITGRVLRHPVSREAGDST